MNSLKDRVISEGSNFLILFLYFIRNLSFMIFSINLTFSIFSMLIIFFFMILIFMVFVVLVFFVFVLFISFFISFNLYFGSSKVSMVETSPSSAFNMNLVVGLKAPSLVPNFSYIYNITIF